MAKFTCIPPAKGSSGEVSGRAATAKLKYASDNTTALGTIPTFNIPDGKIDHLTAKFQRFCGWSEEFAVTIYWPVCYMTLLGDCNSMFDTLVSLTAALKARLPGIEEDPAHVDCSIPWAVTLICQAETVADQQSLLCTSEELECDCTECIDSSQMSTFCCSTETLINNRSTAHGGDMHQSTLDIVRRFVLGIARRFMDTARAMERNQLNFQTKMVAAVNGLSGRMSSVEGALNCLSNASSTHVRALWQRPPVHTAAPAKPERSREGLRLLLGSCTCAHGPIAGA
jgi:hypothetical protein